jgi:hypothetical protein
MGTVLLSEFGQRTCGGPEPFPGKRQHRGHSRRVVMLWRQEAQWIFRLVDVVGVPSRS